MGDTVGLLKSRGAWTDAVAAGETQLTHKEWYEQLIKEQQAEQSTKDRASIAKDVWSKKG